MPKIPIRARRSTRGDLVPVKRKPVSRMSKVEIQGELAELRARFGATPETAKFKLPGKQYDRYIELLNELRH